MRMEAVEVQKKVLIACKFAKPVEVWISSEIVIKGEFVNAVFLPKPKGDPFKEAQETPSYIYCKKCNEYYDDYMEPEPCEHICLSNDGELVYRDNGEKVNDQGKVKKETNQNMNELEQDKRYVFGDMIIVASIDANSNPILKISTDAGNVIVMPSSDNKIIVKSTVDK